MKTLIEQLAALKVEARTKLADAAKALEAGDTDKAQSLRAEAQGLLKKAETVKAIADESAALEGLKIDVPEPMRPMLPGTSGQTLPTLSVAPADPPQAAPAVKAAYAMRFGETDSAIKAVLTDLHGADYEGQYFAHKAAFNRYLRGGEAALTTEHQRLLKTMVLTPGAVKEALMKGLDVAAMKATLVDAIDSLGGYLVPVDFQARIIERMQGLTVMRGRANVTNTSRDRVEFPKATGGDDQYTSAVRVSWVAETGPSVETNPTWGLDAIDVHTMMAHTYLSRNHVEDAAVDIESYLVRQLGLGVAIDEDNRFLVGDGVGKPKGILPGGTNGLGLTEVVTGDANLVTWDGLIDLSYGVATQYRNRCVYIMERATVNAIAKLKDGNGQYLWREQFGNNVAGQARTLNGFPVLEQEVMPSVAANAYPILFGDPDAYTIVDRLGMAVERFLDSGTALSNRVVFVLRRRLGGKLLEPWRWAVQKVAAS
jgi:HK97 family phage major capsid protein